jgi:nitrite reductase (NADH) large subunit
MNRKIVIIGSGMVSHHFIAELNRLGARDITCLGDEEFIDRTKLVHLLDGSENRSSLTLDNPNCNFIRGKADSIDRRHRAVLMRGERFQYDLLVLATGARSVIPPIKGADLAVPLRTLADAQRILHSEANEIAVIGGGVLGIEVAHALRNTGKKISVVHMRKAILERQMDEETSVLLQTELEKEGVRFYLGDAASEITRKGVNVKDQLVPAGLVVLCAGVVPDDHLAKTAGLECNQGVIVNDQMLTNDPSIYAIGDCTRHQGDSYCLVQTGYKQAEIAANHIAGIETAFKKHNPATRLKTHHKAFAIGTFNGTAMTYKNPHHLRKIWLDEEGRITSAVVFGDWENLPSLHDYLSHGKVIPIWRQLSFKLTGELFPLTHQHPRLWADDAMVCQCLQVSCGTIRNAIQSGCTSIPQVMAYTTAGSGCGSCKPLLAQLLTQKPEPVIHAGKLQTMAAIAMALSLAVILFSVPFPESFKQSWDVIWRSNFFKQVSGYSMLTVGILLAVIGLRKRSEKLSRAGNYDTWRLIHTALGLLAVAGVVIHSGARFGDGINFLLTSSLVLTMASGSIYGLWVAREHKNPNPLIRSLLNGTHLLFMGLLPVLVIYHIIQVNIL